MDYDNENDLRLSNKYPECSPWQLISKTLPGSEEIYSDLNITYGGYVTPFIGRNDNVNLMWKIPKSYCRSSNIAKCHYCGGYISMYCDISYQRWTCALCGNKIGLINAKSRYRSDRKMIPELTENLLDLPTPLLPNSLSAISTYNLLKYDPYNALLNTDADTVGSHRSLFGNNRDNEIASNKQDVNMIMGELAPYRPLVHILIIQEKMSEDCLELVTESIRRVVNSIHPDVHVLLMTYCSDGVYVYNINDKYMHTTRQFIHFIKNSANVVPSTPLQKCIDFMSAIKRVEDCATNIVSALRHIQHIQSASSENEFNGDGYLGVALHAVVDWITDTCDMSNCLKNGMQSKSKMDKSAYHNLSTAFPTYDVALNEVGAHEASASDSTKSASNSSKSTKQSAGSRFSRLMSGFSDLLSVSLGLSAGDADDVAVDHPLKSSRTKATEYASEDANGMISGSGSGAKYTEKLPPVDRCSGIIVHCFFSNNDTKECVPPRHISIQPDGTNSNLGSVYNPQWANRLGRFCGENSINIQLYPVQSYSSSVNSMCTNKINDVLILSSLSTATGGQIYPCTIGHHMHIAALRLSQVLLTTMCTTQYATKGILKLRGSTCVLDGFKSPIYGSGVHPYNPTGSVLTGSENNTDGNSDIYRVPLLTNTTCVGFNLHYITDGLAPLIGSVHQTRNNTSRAVMLQLAYTYETLVESDIILASVTGNSNPSGLDHHRHYQRNRSARRKEFLHACEKKKKTKAGSVSSNEKEKVEPVQKAVVVKEEGKITNPHVSSGISTALNTPLHSQNAVAAKVADNSPNSTTPLATPTPASDTSSAPTPAPSKRVSAIASKYKISRPPLRSAGFSAAAKADAPVEMPQEPVAQVVNSKSEESADTIAPAIGTNSDNSSTIDSVYIANAVTAPSENNTVSDAPSSQDTNLLPDDISNTYIGSVVEQLDLTDKLLGCKGHFSDVLDSLRTSDSLFSVNSRGKYKMRVGENCYSTEDYYKMRPLWSNNHKSSSVHNTIKYAAYSLLEGCGNDTDDQVFVDHENQYQCCYNHNKALVAVRRLRIINLVINCAPLQSVQGLIRDLLPTNHAFITLKMLFFVSGSSGGTSLGNSPMIQWLLDAQSLITVLYHSSNGMNQELIQHSKHKILTTCPLFLHMVSLLCGHTLKLYEEVNDCATSNQKPNGKGDSNTQRNEAHYSIDTLLSNILQAPQFARLIQLFYGIQDTLLHMCVLPSTANEHTTATSNSGGHDNVKDDADLCHKLLELLVNGRNAAGSVDFAYLLSLINSFSAHDIDKYFYPKLYGINHSNLLNTSDTPVVLEKASHEAAANNANSSILPLKRSSTMCSVYHTYLMDTGFEWILYNTDKIGVNDADETIDCVGYESDQWIVNEILRRHLVSSTPPPRCILSTKPGTAHAYIFNKHLIEDYSRSNSLLQNTRNNQALTPHQHVDTMITLVEYKEMIEKNALQKLNQVLQL